MSWVALKSSTQEASSDLSLHITMGSFCPLWQAHKRRQRVRMPSAPLAGSLFGELVGLLVNRVVNGINLVLFKAAECDAEGVRVYRYCTDSAFL